MKPRLLRCHNVAPKLVLMRRATFEVPSTVSKGTLRLETAD